MQMVYIIYIYIYNIYNIYIYIYIYIYQNIVLKKQFKLEEPSWINLLSLNLVYLKTFNLLPA